MRNEGANQKLGSPLALLAHELKAPLAASRSALAVVLAGELGELTAQQREYLENAVHLDDYMINLVTSWADMERLSQGLIHLELEPCNSGVVVRQAVDELGSLAQRSGRVIEYSRGSSWPMVLADPLRFKQIMINLLSNALRHGVRDAPLSIRARVQASQCVLTIHDQSAGQTQQRQQIVSALRAEAPTAQLGLRIARLLAEAHGGTLRLDPHAANGIVFHLHLPLAQQMSLLDDTVY